MWKVSYIVNAVSLDVDFILMIASSIIGIVVSANREDKWKKVNNESNKDLTLEI